MDEAGLGERNREDSRWIVNKHLNQASSLFGSTYSSNLESENKI